MSPHDRRIARDLGRLHDLAQLLFDLVSDEYRPIAAVTLQLKECAAVADNPHCADPVVRIVLVAQLLWHATRNPVEANPRHVVGLGLFADELIPELLTECPPDAGETAQRLHDLRREVGNLCLGLTIAADPGMPDFLRG